MSKKMGEETFSTGLVTKLVLVWAMVHPAANSIGGNLEKARTKAMNENSDVLIRRQKVEEADERVGRAHSRYFPTLGVIAGENDQSTPTYFIYSRLNIFNGFRDATQSGIA